MDCNWALAKVGTSAPKQKRLINELPSLVHPKGGWPFDSSHRLEVIILWTSFYVDIFHPGHPGFVFFLRPFARGYHIPH